MVDIHSRRDGPLPQDAKAKRFIAENQSTITRLADQLTSGGYSAQKQQKAQRDAQAQQARLIAEATPSLPARARDSGAIAIKISVNNRVLSYDQGSGRQIDFLGEIRRDGPHRYFAFATRENGFISPAPEAVQEKLLELDGQIIDQNCPETLLAAEIAERLGYC